MSAEEPVVPVLAAILRRYCFAYTASHDLTVCDEIMVDDYVLRMGEHEIRGRDDRYKPATQRQYRQFPGLGLTVHGLLVTPDRAALHFSEHGLSVLTGTAAAWNGISLYRWDGHRLTECRVEQDYSSRRRQLQSGDADPVAAPAHDPWARPVEEPDAEVEAVTRRWLQTGGLATLPAGWLDDEPVAAAARVTLAEPIVEVLDCFSGAHRAAFHARASGEVRTWAGGPAAAIGRPATVYYAGVVDVADGRVTHARVVSDRLAAERRVTAD